VASSGSTFAQNALAFLGTPYVFGGANPSGFDCSGLVEYVLTKMGLKGVPRTSEEQYAWADPISASQLQPGDLVFMNFPGELSPGHVMIWLGGNQVLQAPAQGQDVQVSKFDPQSPGTNEWGGTVVGYGRVPGLSYQGEPAAVTSQATAAGGCLPVLGMFAAGTCILVELVLHFT
jgi:cell wall-associated NlpC family hydrolase